VSRAGQQELTDGIASGPDDEVHGNGYRLLGLPGHIPREHRQGEGLCRPEREGDVVTDKQTDSLGMSVRGNGHEEDGADERAVVESCVSKSDVLQRMNMTRSSLISYGTTNPNMVNKFWFVLPTIHTLRWLAQATEYARKQSETYRILAERL
jgi:hypothetical protein